MRFCIQIKYKIMSTMRFFTEATFTVTYYNTNLLNLISTRKRFITLRKPELIKHVSIAICIFRPLANNNTIKYILLL